MDTFNKLAELFREFPGIGQRQAKRFAYFLLSREASFLENLASLISELKQNTAQCKECFRFYARREGVLSCPICTDQSRGSGELAVVAKDTDLEAMEKSGMYRGKYFVLGGTMTFVEKKNASILRLKELEIRVKRDSKAGVLKEVILALSANPDGEHTSDELRKVLSTFPVKISTLGRGLSTGSELEYADKETLKSAFKNRSASQVNLD